MKIDFLSGSNVISLASTGMKTKSPAIAQIEAYWDGLRNGRIMPTRAEVDPRGISDALEFAFILERIAPGHARIRLAGGHLNDLLGMEVRGMPLTSLFLPEARLAVQKAVEAIFTGPASMHLNLSSDTGLTRPRLNAQMFMAPMKDERGAVTRILGALHSNGRIGRSPRRFKIDTQTSSLLVSGVEDISHTMRPKQHVAENIEKSKGFREVSRSPLVEGAKKGAHLRLVCDNDA